MTVRPDRWKGRRINDGVCLEGREEEGREVGLESGRRRRLVIQIVGYPARKGGGGSRASGCVVPFNSSLGGTILLVPSLFSVSIHSQWNVTVLLEEFRGSGGMITIQQQWAYNNIDNVS